MMKIIALKIYRYRKKKIGIYANTVYIFFFFSYDYFFDNVFFF
jgi:hypothetical protein